MSIQWQGLHEFIQKLESAASGGLRQEMSLWLEAMGFQFLEEVQLEIIRTQTVDTRRLLNSFDKGDSDGVWILTNGGLMLEVGTNVTYASYANDGHWQENRWVPGRWNGDKFEYDPNAKTGMRLRARWVPGTHYWDSALAIFEQMFNISLDRKLQEWMNRSF
jgi:hypothetical protein